MAQLNDLLVTGDSRFLNEINGKIDWSNILSKPTIPAAANNGTLTIQKNGTNVQTFTANQSTNATANITVPTKVSELTNDSGYTTLTIGTTSTTAMAGNTNVNNVTQTNTTDNADYRVLLSYEANDTTQTNTIQKNTNLKYNPSTGNLQTTKLNGVTVGSSPKFTDTNTHRPIKVNGTTILGDNTVPFNLVSGDNVRMAVRMATTGSGSVTIHADQIDDSYTYDQYQDLPSTTKMQDKIFMVKDAPNPPAIPIVDEYAREQIVDVKSNLTELSDYSTTEQAVGKWIDGKTLYRKVYTCPSFSVTSSSTVQTYTVFTFPSNTNIIKYFCVLNHSSSEYMLPYANGNKTTSCVGIKGTTPYIQIRVTNDGWTSVTVTTEAYYTKNS